MGFLDPFRKENWLRQNPEARRKQLLNEIATLQELRVKYMRGALANPLYKNCPGLDPQVNNCDGQISRCRREISSL